MQDTSPESDVVAAYIAEVEGWRGDILRMVRELIQSALPDVVEEMKWKKPSNPSGVPVWSSKGIICTGEVYKDKVKFTFAKGAAIPDPQGVFNASLEGNARRALDIFEGDTINVAALAQIVRQAAGLNTKGK